MEQMNKHSQSPTNVKIIHVKVMDGTPGDIRKISETLDEWINKANLPYRLNAIITNDKINVADIDNLIKELTRLKESFIKELKELKKKDDYDAKAHSEMYP